MATTVVPSLTPVTTAPSETPQAAATATSTATAAPTSTPTSTPTAVPITVAGDPRAIGLQEPAAQDNVACGTVDLFDFPLDPPHAQNVARGGGDFGIFRSRYDKYHAGEDWWTSRGSSLGAPVYSIGHGRVTYAEPLGWGRDQGVIIVRHTFSDGRETLSFYGHLDPESFVVASGDCVARGELIAKIGKPKTSPHLHFEMRTHMPLETGTGYWFEDPTLAGWQPPSATIWDSRMAASPGVLWTGAFSGNGIQGVEIFGDEFIIVFDGEQLIGLDLDDGAELWRAALDDGVEEVLLMPQDRQIVTADQLGVVTALALPEEFGTGVNELAVNWQVDLDVVGMPALIPLADGALVLSTWDRLIALSADGDRLWEADLETRPYDWLISGDRLIVSTTTGLWVAGEDGLQQWRSNHGGHLAAAGDQVLLYDGQTLSRLDSGSRSAAALFELPNGNLQESDVAALPGGGAIITHAGPADQRLMAVDTAGDLLWERSIADLSSRSLSLFADQNRVFLVPQNSGNNGSEMSLFGIALDEASLMHLFSGGTRDSRVDQTELLNIGNGRTLINIDGRSLTVLDMQEASDLVSSIRSSSR